MAVRAKFKVGEIKLTPGNRVKLDAQGKPEKDERGYEKYEACEMQTVTLYPVCHNGDPQNENTKFWAASPSGKIELGCVNPAANVQFKLGDEFYVDFTMAN